MLAQTPVQSKSAPATQNAAAPATKATPADSPLLHPSTLKAKAPDNFKVKFATTHGDFVVEVHRDWSPNGADRFYNLVKNKFFNDATFFRYVPNFIVQFGIPADPKVSAVWRDAKIPADPIKPANSNKKGTLVYAQESGAPNSRTTQFFVNVRDNSQMLDGQNFTAFAEVIEGMDIVTGLYSGYGGGPDEGGHGPNQDLGQTQGKEAYLDKNFPKLDSIKSTTVLPAEGAAPAAAPKAPKK